jgi:Na+/H+-dicarboxylate symporter
LKKLTLTSQTLIALSAGILLGIAVGEYAANLQMLGDAYVMLLQMAVLPYFVVTLILGLGSITVEQAKQLGIRGAAVLALLWSMCFIMIFSLPLTFPALESASFFSVASIQPPQELDFLKLYIPANPFNTLAEGVIPGIVIFGMAVGIALMTVPDKKELLSTLTVLQEALIRVTQFVVKLTPIGVFALAAAAAGTMTIEEFERLQVYFIVFTVGALILTVWLVPMLISSLTPFTYKEIFRSAKDPLVTGFTTGNLLVVLPMLTENIKKLFHDKNIGDESTDSVVGTAVPIAYPFPDIGTLLILVFIPFAAWFAGSPLGLGDYPKFAIVGFFSFFGNVEIGMPFLLDSLRLPADMFELYLMTLVYIGRFATLVAVIHVTGLAVLTACAVAGVLRINKQRMLQFAGISVAIMVVVLGGTRLVLLYTVSQTYTLDKTVAKLTMLNEPLPAVVHLEVPDQTKAKPLKPDSLLKEIRRRGVLKVGYVKDALPYSFINDNNELVGFDVEMAHLLAKDIGVKLEFVPFARHSLLEQLAAGHFDIAMSGIITTPQLIEEARVTNSYIDIHYAVVVEDHRRDQFETMADIAAMESLKLGVLGGEYVAERIEEEFPKIKLKEFTSPQEFFDGGFLEVDAFVMSAEAASVWTLLNPEFSVVVPQPAGRSVPLTYVVANKDRDFADYVSYWIELQQKGEIIKQLYAHWILGKAAEEKEPRWSIIRNVLHWVE